MGIFSKKTIKEKLFDIASNASQKGSEIVSAASNLSNEQVKALEEKREAYLTQMPSPDSEGAKEQIRRKLGAMSVEICHSYLPQISSLYLPVKSENRYNLNNCVRYFNISKWVNDSEENSIEKLMNVYQVLNGENCNIALIYNRETTGCEVTLAVVDNSFSSEPTRINTYNERLLSAVKGNFPGTEIPKKKIGTGLPPCLKEIDNCSVAAVSNLATEKSENFISQSMEKLLDGIIPKSEETEYTIVLLATPVVDQNQRKLRLCELYSQLAPYAEWSTNFTYTDTDTVNAQVSVDVNVGSSIGAQAQANANASAKASAKGNAKTSAGFKSGSGGGSGSADDDMPKSGSQSFGNNFSSKKITDKINLNVNINSQGLQQSLDNLKEKLPEANSDTSANAEANTGASAGANAYAGMNFGMDFARSSSITATVGKNEGITQNFINFNVKHTLDNLETQMKRLDKSSALGMWDFAAYILSEDSITVNNVAHTYLALTQGDESYMSQSAINIWHRNYGSSRQMKNENEQAKHILKSISILQHPVFALKATSEDWAMYPSVVTATTALSGKELAYSLNFPRKSVSGFPVLECAPFGRNIISYQELKHNLCLGNIYHMHRTETGSEVLLDKDSLISHVFIAGSIGAGKSNTVSVMLDRMTENSDIKFLVIEPAKGEYKNIFGGRKDVAVYGTNPKLTDLLRINPFSFPSEISVSEHIDRLIEIFNVCWPMYSAMPAILKEAIIAAYEKVGWNINTSTNLYYNILFPDLSNLLEQVKIIVKNNEYSSAFKGDYIDILLSHIRSLTNGMNGQIFTSDSIDDYELFDKNVIVDLSRMGSSETRSFIMGILVMKLQEYRLANKTPDKKIPEHITVLEDAHNLLRRTSSLHDSESSSLLGKSVEALTNSISELRAFGEGFIIVDQAPELLDTAIIRNTNTKIIHRLPELSDRELVGKAIGLNSSQINELSKLDLGVAAIYQNDWIEPILCQIDKFEDTRRKSYRNLLRGNEVENDFKRLKETLIYNFLQYDCSPREVGVDLQALSLSILYARIKTSIKYDFFEYFTSDRNNETDRLARLVYDFSGIEEVICVVERSVGKDNPSEWIEKVARTIGISEKIYGKQIYDKIIACILMEQVNRDFRYKNVLQYFAENK